METTIDAFLGGSLMISQPTQGYRAGMDPVLLAAAVDAKEGQTILDVGAGVGVASLCLKWRAPSAQVTALEVQPSLATLCHRNSQLNHLDLRIIEADILNSPLKGELFDYVMTNPPYFMGEPSPHKEKALGRTENLVDLQQWLTFSLKRLKSRGKLTLIYRMDRLDEVIKILAGKVGNFKLYPLWSSSAKLFILQGTKESKGGLTLYRGLHFYDEEGVMTSQAEDILRRGHSITLDETTR